MNNMSGIFGVVVAILVLLKCTEAQTVHVVGDASGWRVPQDSSVYQNWASGKNFAVGDILSFNFQTGEHNVIEVSENSCNSANRIGTTYESATNITLNRGGEHYFICGVGNHCNNGQMLAITVSGSSSAVPPAAATTPPPPASSATSSTSFSAFIHFLFFITFMLSIAF